ncbi:MAG: helix-turn-helix transcriptional regulator [Armatimonadota bacterium]
MNGFDILKARKAAGVSQQPLAKALGLRGGRGTLTDIEGGLVEVTPSFAIRAIAMIQQIADQNKNLNAAA